MGIGSTPLAAARHARWLPVLLFVALAAAAPVTSAGWSSGTSHNVFVRAGIDDDWFVTSRSNLATRNGIGDLFFGYADINLGRRLSARWSIEGGYRQARLQIGSRWRKEHRPLLNLTWRGAIGEFPIANRHRLEFRFFESATASDRIRYRNETRLVFPARLAVAGLRPFVEEEFFYEFTDDGFATNWLTAGLSHRLAKNVTVKLGYRWQAQKQGGDWDHRHVLVTGLSWFP